MKTTDRMTVNVHDIEEFHGFILSVSNDVMYYAERLRDYNPDNLPPHIIIHDDGDYTLYHQSGSADMYCRPYDTDYFQLIPKYYHGNTAYMEVLGEERLVIFREGTQNYSVVAVKEQGCALVTKSPDISQRYAEWLLLSHKLNGSEIPMFPTVARKLESMGEQQFKVFSYNERVE